MKKKIYLIFILISQQSYGQVDGTLLLKGYVRPVVDTKLIIEDKNIIIKTIPNSKSKYDIFVDSKKFDMDNEISIPNQKTLKISIISK